MDYKILIVDDIPKNIQLLANILEPTGCHIEFATNGTEAMDWVINENFDLILLDVMMPGKNGYEVCKEIKSLPEKQDIPIIFLTAKADLDSITKGFEMGGVDYVTKPFNSKELISRISAHADLRRGRLQLRTMNSILETKVEERTRELEKARKQLEVLDIAKSQFLRIISHEVRTPLNGIINSVALLKMSPMTENMDVFLKILDTSVIRLEKFSFTALQISELILLKTNALIIKSININKLIEKCITKNNAFPEGINFQLNSEKECFVSGDMDFLKTCINELLNNAITHANSNEPINIQLKPGHEFTEITITDRGQGFSPQALENLFKPFSPGQEHINDNPGLGLFFAKLVIEAHQGTIKAGNLSKRGAFITIQLPNAKKNE